MGVVFGGKVYGFVADQMASGFREAESGAGRGREESTPESPIGSPNQADVHQMCEELSPQPTI